jgi:hypothetical protein
MSHNMDYPLRVPTPMPYDWCDQIPSYGIANARFDVTGDYQHSFPFFRGEAPEIQNGNQLDGARRKMFRPLPLDQKRRDYVYRGLRVRSCIWQDLWCLLALWRRFVDFWPVSCSLGQSASRGISAPPAACRIAAAVLLMLVVFAECGRWTRVDTPHGWARHWSDAWIGMSLVTCFTVSDSQPANTRWSSVSCCLIILFY